MEEKTLEFVYPSRIMWMKETYRDNYGQLIVEPLERGFGVTIGNTLRRVLLSSIPGIAITGLKISGAQHEFTTIQGVKEDTTQIVLNLKQVICKPVISEFPHISSTTISGVSEICARDLVRDGSVEILNPDLHIATIDPSAKLIMDIEITSGRGYLPVEKMKLIRKDISLDTILIDAIYTPVKKVAFHVENTRVGPLVDYEKLILDVWTNGAVTPDAALKIATDILNTHFMKIGTIQMTSGKPVKTETSPVEDELNISVTELDLSTRIINILQQNGIRTLRDIIEIPRGQFEEMKNFGKKTIQEIEEALEKKGYKLKGQEQT
ncbi:MAG: DNA-directed RNA polymerase subunit alpha [Candidatus Omnitrophica bacterium]|nr:DNA-directed RNA polymerase subunit alpha [Candidatus Omnitrophota bacterium]